MRRCEFGSSGLLKPINAGSKMKIFEQSGHQPFFEEPESFAAAVTDWMARGR